MLRVLAAAALALAVAGCATPQTDRLLADPGSLPPKAAVADPVFFAQRTRECGPAALAMILAQSGVSVTPDALVAEVYNPGRGGSLTPALVAATRRAGRVAYPVGDLGTVLREVEAGHPVLVLQNLALSWVPQWHYAVVVGYDFGDETVTLHSGETAFHRMPMRTFEHTWARGGNWGLLALRPGAFPATVAEDEYVRAVAGLERAGRVDEAARGYAAALARWPGDFVARMGYGNVLYRTGDQRGAASAFRAAAFERPDSADAHNNLAHVLAELGQFVEAERAARTAVKLGGANAHVYRETLTSIVTARAGVERR